MKAVLLDRGAFPQNIHIQLPTEISEYIEYDITSPEQVAERIHDADIILTNKALVQAADIQKANKLKYIQVLATGTNNIDHHACRKAGIQVANVEGYSTETVPEHTFAMLLNLRRSMFQYVQDVKQGQWSNSDHFCFLDYPIKDLKGSTFVIVGKGSLGSQIGILAKAFGMQVIYAERKHASVIREGYMAFDEAIKLADVLGLNCPLTPDTKDMIAASELSQLKPSSLLLNLGRGGLVNEQDLVVALKEKQIAGAGFDVASVEPIPSDHPFNEILDYPNFLLTPHIAWASEGAIDKLLAIAINNIKQFLAEQK
ncbi:D-2-hydroxyacid dehydrogenase [Marinomonas epiphytica]